MANMSQDLDFDLFGDAYEEQPEEVTEAPAPELEVEEEPAEATTEDVVDEAVDEAVDEVPADDTTESPEPAEEDLDIDALVEEILNWADEVDDKVEEIKQEASSSGNEDLLNMIDELQTLLAEKNQQIAELNKKDEITSGRLMDTYGDAENYSFYKWTINKLEENPQLMMLVKNYNSENEKAQERVLSILSDMIFEKTGEDISQLINTNQKNNVSNALTNVEWWRDASTPEAPAEEDLDYNASINDLF